MELREYLVWFDKELHELLSIEKVNMTTALEEQLKKEDIKVESFMADSLKDSLEQYIAEYEKNNKQLKMEVSSRKYLH